MKNEDMKLEEVKGIIDSQNKYVKSAMPQGYVFNFIYGMTWAIGYGALYLTRLSELGYLLFAISIALGIIVSVGYLFTRLRGIRNSDSKYRKWWGIGWMIGFCIHSVLVTEVLSMLSGNLNEALFSKVQWILGNTVPLLIVSLCLLSGAAIFKEKNMGIVGLSMGILTIITINCTALLGVFLCMAFGIIMLLLSALEFYKSR